jgi:DNA mismatch repair ATPase MutL
MEDRLKILEYYKEDLKSILRLITNRLIVLNPDIQFEFINDIDDDLIDYQKFDRDQKLKYIFGETSIILNRLKYNMECGDIQDLKMHGWTTNQIIFECVSQFLPEISKYKKIYFSPRYLTMNHIMGRNVINFYLYIENETEEI